MRRIALMVLLVLLAATISPALADTNPSDVAADFNNDGAADLAVGVPGENDFAGAVNVLYGAAGGLSGIGAQVFAQVGGAVEAADEFGSALAAGDFNHDGFADLAVSAPFEDVGGANQAGAVSVLYGSASGLTTSGGRLFTQVGGTVETRDLFGWSLTAGNFNNDGFVDVAAGAPWETVGSLGRAGAVSVLPGSGGGLTSTGGQLFTQARAGGTVEAGDQFGAQLAAGDFNNNGFADLAAAAPSESVGSAFEAGAVSVLRTGAGLTTGYLYTQNSPGVPGTAESADHFGGIGFQAE